VKWLGWVAAVALVLVLIGQLGAEAHLRARVAARDSSIARLETQRDSALRQLVAAAAKVDTLVDSLWLPQRARVESLPVDRPVPYPVYVEAVAAADTTIRACRRALHDCAAVVHTDSLLIDSLHAQVRDLRRAPALRRWVYAATDGRRLYGGAEATWRPPLLPVTAYGRVELRADSLVRLDARVGLALPF
jgi:hypothetical protein